MQFEKAIVGAVVLNPSWADEIMLKPEHFFDPKAARVWQAISDLRATSSKIDVLIVEDKISEGVRDTSWVAPFVAECAAEVPTEAHAKEYAIKIREAARLRKLRIAIDELALRLRRDELTADEAISDGMAALAEIGEEGEDPAREVAQIVGERVRQLEKLVNAKARGEVITSGAPTGVVGLDRQIGGWPYQICSIVASRPGMGKSSLGIATARACTEAGIGVHVFSLEDFAGAYADRVLAQHSDVSAEVIRSLEYTEATMGKLSSAIPVIAKRKQWLFDDTSGMTAEDVVRRVRRRARENKTRCVIVDYVQLLKWPRGAASQHDALGRSITILADAAKTDRVAYVVMSQLNRQLEQRPNKRPMLSDLRESGSLEERAKVVVGLYRGSYYGKPVEGVDYEPGDLPDDYEWQRRAELLVLKNSQGAPGMVPANWDGPSTRIW